LNVGCGDCHEGLEALVRLAGEHYYAYVFLQFSEVVLDQMPPFIGFLVERRRELPVRFWRYDGDDAASASKALSRQQAKVDEVAEGVRQRQYFRCYAAAKVANGLATVPLLRPDPSSGL
jgi:hypothetical protein